MLVVFFKKPNSFTGEEIVEINCHGSNAIITKISKILEILGLRLAEPGEFTRRSLMNDKLDLLQTEGLADLINSETEKQRSMAISGLSGKLSKFVNKTNDLFFPKQNHQEIFLNLHQNQIQNLKFFPLYLCVCLFFLLLEQRNLGCP